MFSLESIRRYFRRTDKIYLLMCVFSSAMAVAALSSWAAKQGNGFAVDEVTGQITGIGDYRRALVQAGAAAIGLAIAVLLSNIDYRSLVKVWPVHVVLTWGLVLPTLFIRNVSIGPLTIGYNAGDTDNYSWYKLGGFTFQPTELAKISFILTFAMHLNNVRTRINEPKELGKLLLHLLVPILIIHVQGDDGTAIIYGIIGCCMMFAAGLSWKYIIGAVSAAAAAMAVAFAFFSDKIGKGYQWYRILAVIDPDNKTGWAPSEEVWKNIIYQQQRGEIALGSGGIFGNGLFGGSYYSVPNAHNDFILSWIGNATGFVGCCVVLGVLFALVIKTFLTGARSEDLLGTFICAGIGGCPYGPDRGQCGHEPAHPARHRRHPALLFGGRQLGADAVHLCGAGAFGLYAQHQKAVRLRSGRRLPLDPRAFRDTMIPVQFLRTRKQNKEERTVNSMETIAEPSLREKAAAYIRQYVVITLSISIMSVGVYFFKFPNNFVFGGVTGAAALAAKLTPLSASAFSSAANLILLAVGLIFLGKKVCHDHRLCHPGHVH